jgi:uncharacterized protein (TIGR00251 family)
MPPWTETAAGLLVAVKVQPNARRAAVGGLAASEDGERLRIAVTSPPEDGKATIAAAQALARALDVATSAVTLVRGATSRQKTFQVVGDGPRLIARLELL